MGVKFWVASWLAVLAGCASSGEDPPDPMQQRQVACSDLRDHVVELRLAGATQDLDQHRATMKAALGASFVDDCVARYADAEIRCVRDAADDAAARGCVAAK